MGPLGDLHRQFVRVAAARDVDVDLRAHLQALTQPFEAAHRLAAERDDDVADQEARPRGRSVVSHRADEQAVDAHTVTHRAHRLRGDAEIALLHAAMREQRLDHAVDRRYRQHHPVMSRKRGAGHAEHAPLLIGHCCANEPRVQAAIEANQTFDTASAPGAPRPGHRADAAEARLHMTGRFTADREYRVADARCRIRSTHGHRHAAIGEGHHGEIGGAIDAAHGAVELLAVGQHHGHAGRPPQRRRTGHHHPGAPQHARTALAARDQAHHRGGHALDGICQLQGFALAVHLHSLGRR